MPRRGHDLHHLRRPRQPARRADQRRGDLVKAGRDVAELEKVHPLRLRTVERHLAGPFVTGRADDDAEESVRFVRLDERADRQRRRRNRELGDTRTVSR